jgi:hypothetical protein
MCEYCKKTEVTIETLDTDDQYPCEWITEEAGPGACAELALYSVSEWYVEDHLCDAHKLATEKEMEEGLRDFLDSVEFRSQFEMKPIAEKRLATTWIRQRRTGRSVGGKRLTQNTRHLSVLCRACRRGRRRYREGMIARRSARQHCSNGVPGPDFYVLTAGLRV